jgi:hypothetical protein
MRSAFHGGLTPPALALQCERLPAKQRFLRCTNVHSPKSGGRQPAVARNRDGGRNATSVGERTLCTRAARRQPAVGGQIRIGRHERHSSAARRRCVCGLSLQLRLKLPRGAYAPRSCVAVRTSAGETAIFAMHKRTFDQERRASARRGAGIAMVDAMRLPSGNARCAQERRASARRGAGIAMVDAMRLPSGNARCAQERRASARRGSEPRWWTQCDFRRGTHAMHKSGGRQPAVGGHMRIGRHERHSSADRQRCVCGLSLQLRLKLPRGAYAPRSCVAVRTSAGETTIFAMHKRTFDQERRASARRGSEIAMVDAMRLPSGNARCAQERRASAAVVRFPSATSEVAIPETNESLGEPTPGGRSNDSVDRAGRSILSAVRRRWHRRTCRTSKTGAEKVPTANTQENL